MKQYLKMLLALLLLSIGNCYATPVDGIYVSAVRNNVEETYMSQLHVRELTGHNDGKEVEEYLQYAGFGKGYAWCAAFVNWVYVNNLVATPKSPAWSPSWFPDKRIVPKEQAQKGDVIGIYYQSKNRIAHVGLVHRWPPGKNYCITVEGNTNGAGSREGDGVYVKRRQKRQIYRVANWIGRNDSQTTNAFIYDIKRQNLYVHHLYSNRCSNRFGGRLQVC